MTVRLVTALGALVSMTRRRRTWCLAPLLLLVLLLPSTPALAQEAPDPPPAAAPSPAAAPAGPSFPSPESIGNAVSQAVLSGLDDWLEQWLSTGAPAVLMRAFLTGLGWLGQRLLGGLAAASGSPGVDVMTRLNADITLGDETVQTVWRAGRNVFDALVGVGLVATGFLVLLRFGGVDAHEVGGLLPRVGIGLVVVNGSLDLLRWLLGVANAGATYLAGAGALGLSAQSVERLPPAEAGGLLLAVAAMTGLLFIQRLVMHGVLDLLAMVAPLAFAAWVIPAWSAWFWRWANLLGALLAGAVFQSMLLAAGGGMLARAAAGAAGEEAQRLVAGAVAVALLGLTIAAPGLVGLGLVGGTTLGLARRLTRTAPLRANVRTPQPQPTGGGKGAMDQEPPRWEEVRSGGEVEGGRREPRTIIYTHLPSLPPSGGASDRPALPPPDYLKE